MLFGQIVQAVVVASPLESQLEVRRRSCNKNPPNHWLFGSGWFFLQPRVLASKSERSISKQSSESIECACATAAVVIGSPSWLAGWLVDWSVGWSLIEQQSGCCLGTLVSFL
jgi:hypothetical protein